ncbi:MAG: pyruvate dehydrogenase (acetyl-transferring), homodimeric type [Pseudomonadota bacterium]
MADTSRLVDDVDPQETREWLDAFASALRQEGPERARFLIERLYEYARSKGIQLASLNTPYINTIPVREEPGYPGDNFMERRIRAIIRWNAMAMVQRANMNDDELGGHISTFASAATLYDVGFNHFFRAPDENFGGDLIYYQGHSAPGIYARAFLEGRLSEQDLDGFRREVDGNGLSSYPHPWLMPEFWQFPTVSMGLASMQSIYQAHFMKYLINRGMIPDEDRKVWCFLGDGEMDEPESLGSIALAGREKLDNLIFVVNCNLQRLDGPVRGNGKIIQELEGIFRGAGWNVIKVVWGRHWDPLLARDDAGLLQKRMNECVDGEYQAFKMHGGQYTREHFFGKYPETAAMVADMSDEAVYNLNRGGHDPYKVYAAYHRAVHHKGQPTVILAKTVKGYGTGAGEAQNKTHQIKKLDIDSLREFRDRFDIPVSDADLPKVPYYKPADDSPEMKYLLERRAALKGHLPQRRVESTDKVSVPPLDTFASMLEGSERPLSTTMAFVRMLTTLMKLPDIGERCVPIVPDEARTFGMEAMFRQYGIYSAVGQLYKPEDAGQVMYYREDKQGRMLEEGINEAGAFSAWMAAGTSYSVNNKPMIPFYVYYSMFGFQRIGDFAWAAGDSQARGFLIGATAGRTTLNGEGLQHQDGHSHLLASTVPNCVSYDPTYSYEMAVILREGLRRMHEEQESVFYYLTAMNENYPHPPMPKGAEEGIIRGMYRLKAAPKLAAKASEKSRGQIVQLLGCGTILREVEAAAEMLSNDFGVRADIWSVTSFNELRRDGLEVQRWNLLNPLEKKTRKSWVEQCLDEVDGPVVAATDYMKLFADQIRPFVRGTYRVLGTDGFGRSDSRQKLREFFEVDRRFVVVAALSALADDGRIERKVVAEAIKRYGIDADKRYPPRC